MTNAQLSEKDAIISDLKKSNDEIKLRMKTALDLLADIDCSAVSDKVFYLYYNSQCLFLCLSLCLSGRCNFCPGRF